MRFNWFRVNCVYCGMDREFPVEVNDRSTLAVDLAVALHNRKGNNFSGCKHGNEVTVTIIERDVEVNG